MTTTAKAIDFADVAADMLSAVAANVGSVEHLLAGRPGSWEADYVRSLIGGTVGPDGDRLPAYRTTPLGIDVDVTDVMVDANVEQAFDDAAQLAYENATTGKDSGDGDAVSAAEAAEAAVYERRDSLYADYGRRLEDEIHKVAAEFGFTVQVTVRHKPHPYSPSELGGFEDSILLIASDRTSLPTV